MRHVVVRSVAALLGCATVAACASSDAAVDEPAQVVILRAVADPFHVDFLHELRDQRLVVGRDILLAPADRDEAHATVEEADAQLDAIVGAPALVIGYSTPYAELAADRFPDVATVGIVNDPVASGLLTYRDRPEGTITGVTFATPFDRTLQLASDVVGQLDRVGFLVPADDPAMVGPRERLAAAAEQLGVEVVEATFAGPADVTSAVDRLAAAEVDVVLLGASNAVVSALDALERELTDAALPVVANTGLATFAVAVLEPDGAEVRRQVARQVARLLRGDAVATVPVEDPRRFRTILDRGRAAALGLPPLDEALLRRADEVR